MINWAEIAVAFIGGGTIGTIGGQILANRSASRRERESRRENFSIQNFATQREALMKMQELANTISREIAVEYLRRLDRGDFKYFDSSPNKPIGQKMLEVFETIEEMNGIVGRLRQDSSGGEKKKLNRELIQAANKVKEGVEALKELNDELIARAMTRGENAWNVITPLIEEFRNNMYRTGSQPVAAAAHAYLKASMTLYTRLVSANIDKFQDDERVAKKHLQTTIAKALKEGPYPE